MLREYHAEMLILVERLSLYAECRDLSMLLLDCVYMIFKCSINRPDTTLLMTRNKFYT